MLYTFDANRSHTNFDESLHMIIPRVQVTVKNAERSIETPPRKALVSFSVLHLCTLLWLAH